MLNDSLDQGNLFISLCVFSFLFLSPPSATEGKKVWHLMRGIIAFTTVLAGVAKENLLGSYATMIYV